VNWSPRYFLHHVLRGNRMEDDEGHEFHNLAAAEWDAIMNIRAIA
jgi:hypothetical protein